MTENKWLAEHADTPLSIFAPAVFLVIIVISLQQTEIYAIYGIYAVFSAFVGGVILAVISLTLLILPERFVSTPVAGTSFLLGLILTVTAALLYLVYGCVLGCPA